MKEDDFKAYKDMFVRHYTGPFAIDRNNGWKTKHQALYDKLIIKQLFYLIFKNKGLFDTSA